MKDELLELMAKVPEEKLLALIDGMPEGEREHLLQIAEEYGNAVKREKGQKSFMEFVRIMWPGFIGGRHHEIMAKAFERVANGELKRLIINMPPRHTKSEFASYLLPAWFLGKFPGKKIIQSSNTGELAVGFGRKVRNLVDGETYTKVFPNVALRHDSKAAGRWSTNANGEYFAIGVGGTVTGKGADLLIIDDPHSEQEAKLAESDPSVFDSVYEWYTSGPRQRLQPGGAIVVVMCMTGDTQVLMADGSGKQLKDIRPGDSVATFDHGTLAVSKVNNWQSSGVDAIYKIQTQSGRILRANERHPFLVMNEGVLEWTRVNQLRKGDLLVSLSELRRISDFTVDPIVSITPDGQEEVFDVEVDRTENFIANGVVSHNTRWSKRDLTGRVIKDSVQRGGDEWEVIEFPAILPSGNPLWPQFWSFEELDALRKELPNAKWQAQYQQNPVSDSAAIVKREWWRMWTKDEPPYCEFTLMAWDTAFEKSTRADYSACTIWGVFYHPDDHGAEQANIILLNAIRDRVEFPELKRMVLQTYKDWEPDSTIIEKKASGAPLIYELRAMGISVQEFTPVKGNDKITRLNAVSDLFASGRVWAPNRNWAEEVIDEVASFPSGDHDDYVDTVSLALMRFRRGGYIRSALDEEDDVKHFRSHRASYY